VIDDDLAGGVVAARIIGVGRAFDLDLLDLVVPGERCRRLLGMSDARGGDGGGEQGEAEWRFHGMHVRMAKEAAAIVRQITGFLLPLRKYF
jgi:hypothetical protein